MSEDKAPSDFELYKIALETRNMEIGLFWQRSNYFLILNTATAVGFFKGEDKYQIWVGIFGFLVSLLWFCVNLGSKFWQSRWEERLKKVEKKFGKGIDFFSASRKTVNADVKANLNASNHNNFQKIFDELVLMKPSVSFMMTLLSLLFILLWLLLIVVS